MGRGYHKEWNLRALLQKRGARLFITQGDEGCLCRLAPRGGFVTQLRGGQAVRVAFDYHHGEFVLFTEQDQTNQRVVMLQRHKFIPDNHNRVLRFLEHSRCLTDVARFDAGLFFQVREVFFCQFIPFMQDGMPSGDQTSDQVERAAFFLLDFERCTFNQGFILPRDGNNPAVIQNLALQEEARYLLVALQIASEQQGDVHIFQGVQFRFKRSVQFLSQPHAGERGFVIIRQV